MLFSTFVCNSSAMKFTICQNCSISMEGTLFIAIVLAMQLCTILRWLSVNVHFRVSTTTLSTSILILVTFFRVISRKLDRIHMLTGAEEKKLALHLVYWIWNGNGPSSYEKNVDVWEKFGKEICVITSFFTKIKKGSSSFILSTVHTSQRLGTNLYRNVTRLTGSISMYWARNCKHKKKVIKWTGAISRPWFEAVINGCWSQLSTLWFNPGNFSPSITRKKKQSSYCNQWHI